jgi:hypothetical protein
MSRNVKFALAAAMIVGGATATLAGEGSPDINVPPGYNDVISTPRATVSHANALDAYALNARQRDRAFIVQRNATSPRETGHYDNY